MTTDTDRSGNRDPGSRRIHLLKDAQEWIFTVTPGAEGEVPAALADVVDESGGEFDWFDAAVVCLELSVEPDAPDGGEDPGSAVR